MIGNSIQYNSETEKELNSQFNIRGFPTLLLFKNGQYVTFEGNRTLEEFIQFLNKNQTNFEKIPPRKSWFGKMLNYFNKIVEVYIRLMDQYGMEGFSRNIKYWIVVTLFALACLLIPICITTMCIPEPKSEEELQMEARERARRKPKHE